MANRLYELIRDSFRRKRQESSASAIGIDKDSDYAISEPVIPGLFPETTSLPNHGYAIGKIHDDASPNNSESYFAIDPNLRKKFDETMKGVIEQVRTITRKYSPSEQKRRARIELIRKFIKENSQ